MLMSGKSEMQQQNQNAECGELVLQKLFLEFVRSAERRINASLTTDDSDSSQEFKFMTSTPIRSND